MRHRNSNRKLSRTSSHREAMLRNMVNSLFAHDRIETTLFKAKELLPLADKVVGLAKRGDLHAKRQAAYYLRDEKVCAKVFDEAKSRYQDRVSGYTRLIASRVRRGDAAPMALVELVSPVQAKK
jgi:large subunit ribosomal protein L17